MFKTTCSLGALSLLSRNVLATNMSQMRISLCCAKQQDGMAIHEFSVRKEVRRDCPEDRLENELTKVLNKYVLTKMTETGYGLYDGSESGPKYVINGGHIELPHPDKAFFTEAATAAPSPLFWPGYYAAMDFRNEESGVNITVWELDGSFFESPNNGNICFGDQYEYTGVSGGYPPRIREGVYGDRTIFARKGRYCGEPGYADPNRADAFIFTGKALRFLTPVLRINIVA